MRRISKHAPGKSSPKKTPKAAASPARSLLLAGAALCVLVGIAYGNSLGNGYVWDDHQQIVMNPRVKPGASLAPLFDTDARFPHFDPANQTTVYRPLQMLAYRGVMTAFGGGPAAFHMLSAAFALAGSLALLWLAWLMTRSVGLAFTAAALFAVYPVHTEAVDWIAALPDLGCGLFFMLAMGLFVARRRGLSVASFALALLWKETALVFPLLPAIYVLLGVLPGPAPDRRRDALKASAPYWITVVAYLAVRTWVLGAMAHSPRNWALNPGQFLLSVADLLLEYWVKLAAPVGLSAYHVFHPVRSLADPRAWLALLFVACLGAAVYLLRRARLAVFATAWMVLTLLPALDLDALGRNAFAERYLYLPSAGFCILAALAAGWLLGRLPQGARTPAGVATLGVVLTCFTAECMGRNPDWKDDRTLFAATLPEAEGSPFVHVMVASTHAGEDSDGSYAEQNYRQAVELATQEIPVDRLDAVTAYQGLASIYADRGEFDQALKELAEALALAPDNPDADGEEGIILAHAGRGREAEPLLERALREQPRNENILTALGLVARDEHDLARAESMFREVLAVHTETDDFAASAHNNLGVVLGDENNDAAAIEQFRQAAAMDPGDPEFDMNLATSLAAAGRLAEARTEAETAVRLAPGDAAARQLLERLDAAKP